MNEYAPIFPGGECSLIGTFAVDPVLKFCEFAPKTVVPVIGPRDGVCVLDTVIVPDRALLSVNDLPPGDTTFEFVILSCV